MTFLSAFTRLATDERMPDREMLRTGLRRFHIRLHHQSTGPQHRRFRWIALGVWLMVTAGMIAIGATLGAGGPRGSCGQTMVMTCATPATAHRPAVPVRGTTVLMP